MSERYTRVFTLPSELYTEGSPILLAAGALLLDTVCGDVIAQCKFRNIGHEVVQAITVIVTAYDPAGRIAGEPVAHQYLDLNLNRDEMGGQKIPVFLQDTAARSFTVEITEVIFGNGSIWTPSEKTVWESLPGRETIEDPELLKQYRADVSEKAKYFPFIWKDVFFCSCGAICRSEEPFCHICGQAAEVIDVEAVKKRRDERLAEEQRKVAELRAEKEKRAAARKELAASGIRKTARILKFAVPAILICIAVIAAATQFVLPAMRWNNEKEAISNAEIGSVITFGKYDDNEIEWIVLDIQDGRALLLTRYGVAKQLYNEKLAATDWESCTLREWLNTSFYEEAFFGTEKDAILQATLHNPDNPEYGTSGGNETTDRVFLLSMEEAEQYFVSDEARRSRLVEDTEETRGWWLRTPGMNSGSTAAVIRDGSFYVMGSAVNAAGYMARPALWIDLSQT